jgi:DNA invertase Pin-like site-specific DNA recombinase
VHGMGFAGSSYRGNLARLSRSGLLYRSLRQGTGAHESRSDRYEGRSVARAVFERSGSGGRWDRPELHRLLDQLRKGDVLVVWKLDRLSRSLRDVLTIMERLAEAKAGFRSLTEAIDTTTPAGRMMMQMVGAFAEFERSMLKERTKVGLDAAREEGRVGGRRPKLTFQQQIEIRKMVSKGSKTAADAARLFKVHPATVSRLLARPYAK